MPSGIAMCMYLKYTDIYWKVSNWAEQNYEILKQPNLLCRTVGFNEDCFFIQKNLTESSWASLPKKDGEYGSSWATIILNL